MVLRNGRFVDAGATWRGCWRVVVEGERKDLTYGTGGHPPRGVAGGVAEARGVGGGSQGKRASMPQNVDRERRVPHPFIQIYIHTQTYRFLVDDPSQVDRAAQHVEVVAG